MGDARALIAGDPAVFFSTPHYDRYPYVLVRLGAARHEQLAELLEDAWRVTAPERLVAPYDGAG